jgi:hypothetical protein
MTVSRRHLHLLTAPPTSVTNNNRNVLHAPSQVSLQLPAEIPIPHAIKPLRTHEIPCVQRGHSKPPCTSSGAEEMFDLNKGYRPPAPPRAGSEPEGSPANRSALLFTHHSRLLLTPFPLSRITSAAGIDQQESRSPHILRQPIAFSGAAARYHSGTTSGTVKTIRIPSSEKLNRLSKKTYEVRLL